MMKITIKKEYKSLRSLPTFELPDFCMLTGKNGSGKSHLLEAMSKQEIVNISYNGKDLVNIKFIPFNGLNPKVESDCQYLTLTSNKKQIWSQINILKIEYNKIRERSPQLAMPEILRRTGSNDSTKRLFTHFMDLNNGNVELINEDFFDKNYDISILNPNEVFSSQFAAIFKLYHTRLEDNNYRIYRNEKFGEHYDVLTDDEFVLKYGPKPWTLINEMLTNARLPYRVNNPEGQSKEADFHLCLRDDERNIEIQVNDLSTGEKVLMSLALAIYNTSENEFKPDVLLLDEPDAPLHPEYSKVLVEAVKKSIVEKACVKVIMTTHNPTTIALGDELDIYQMDRNLGYPVKVSKRFALNLLTNDLENLRVSTESRRQIFVENLNDVGYYERIIRLLKVELPISPQFLPPHNRNGSNCEDVKNIVNSLRGLGNDLVYGLVDYDNHNVDMGYVYVIGGQKRYAIDNYIFDPVFVAFLLVREKIVKTSDMGVAEYTFTKLNNLDDASVQIIIDYIAAQLNLTTDERVEYITQNGKKYQISKSYFAIQGHELEQKIMNKWPQLNSVKRGKNDENILKNYMLDNVISEYPEFLSNEFIETFSKIV